MWAGGRSWLSEASGGLPLGLMQCCSSGGLGLLWGSRCLDWVLALRKHPDRETQACERVPL